MTNTDAERAEFEAWVRENQKLEEGWWTHQLPDGGYSSGNADAAWKAWQAARRAPVAVPTDQTRSAWHQAYAQGAESALPSKITPDMRRVFREAYREGGFWADRLDYALNRMLAAAPQPPQGAPTSVEAFALQALVAAGHVSQELVDRSMTLPGAPQPPHANCPPPVDKIEAQEREHMGCADCKTGVYAEPQAQREPLTDQQITLDGLMMTPNSVLESCASAFEAGVRFAERAHGITKEQA